MTGGPGGICRRGRLRLSINPPAEDFGGKDSVKGNRQGSLSRWIKQLFETFLKFQKVRQFHMGTGAASCIYQALNTYLSRRAKAS